MARFLLLGAGMVALLVGCGEHCTNRVTSSSRSPDGTYEAVAFDRDCSDVASMYTQVSIFATTSTEREGVGNTLGLMARKPLELEWTGPARLEIRGSAGVDVLKQETSFDGVSIVYPDR